MGYVVPTFSSSAISDENISVREYAVAETTMDFYFWDAMMYPFCHNANLAAMVQTCKFIYQMEAWY
jgi:hypothetical protein